MSHCYAIKVSIASQTLQVFKAGKLFATYLISSAKNGVGQQMGSEQTPLGRHCIVAKIGDNLPVNTVFRARRPTREIFTPALGRQYPQRDWILTRILWLRGCEPGKNRFGDVDTARRYIYIHGTPDSTVLGKPGSRGCLRMSNADIIALFSYIPVRTSVFIV